MLAFHLEMRLVYQAVQWGRHLGIGIRCSPHITYLIFAYSLMCSEEAIEPRKNKSRMVQPAFGFSAVVHPGSPWIL